MDLRRLEKAEREIAALRRMIGAQQTVRLAQEPIWPPGLNQVIEDLTNLSNCDPFDCLYPATVDTHTTAASACDGTDQVPLHYRVGLGPQPVCACPGLTQYVHDLDYVGAAAGVCTWEKEVDCDTFTVTITLEVGVQSSAAEYCHHDGYLSRLSVISSDGLISLTWYKCTAWCHDCHNRMQIGCAEFTGCSEDWYGDICVWAVPDTVLGCEICPDGAARNYSVTISGVTANNDPSDCCGQVNATLVLAYDADESASAGDCYFFWDGDVCDSGTVRYRANLTGFETSDTNVELTFFRAVGGGTLATYSLPIADWDCLGENVMTRTSTSLFCLNWPATLTVTAV